MPPILDFGHFVIRVAERTLLVNGAPVSIGGRAFDVLLALAERTARVVSKAELLDLAWPGVVVEENNLTVQIAALRRVLGAAAIVTVTGRGYRLAAPLSGAATPEAAREATRESEPVRDGTRLERRVATIAHADVIGWGRLVARDPEHAVQAWKTARVELLERTVPQHGGHLIELTPERIQIEFASAVRGLEWALALQRQLAQRRAGRVALRMRIALCVDDVIVDEGRLIGDGVNVAAEIHQLAGHDDVLVTELVRELTQTRLPVRFEAVGERLIRQLLRPIPLYRAWPDDGDDNPADPPQRPVDARSASVAVLPFSTEGGDTDAYFGIGVTEEIITSLSMSRSLFVIAHSSTLRYRDGHAKPQTIASELGVDYLVTGSVRRAGHRLRIRVALEHADDARTIWTDIFDGTDDDVFAFQARIASSVAGAIDPHVREAEMARVRGRPTESFGAYDCLLRALAGMYRFDTPEFDAAGPMLQRALEQDRDFAQAHAQLAWWYGLRIGQGRSLVGDGTEQQAIDHALKAAALDPRDATCLTVAGHMTAWLQRRLHPGLDLLDQALAINPNSAIAWARSGVTLAYLGRGDEGLARVRNALDLSPYDHEAFTFYAACGLACIVAGRPAEAVAWLGKALRLNPRYNASRRFLIAALVMVGQFDEARALAQELLAEVPHFNLRGFGEWYPLQAPHREALLSALRRAGIPD